MSEIINTATIRVVADASGAQDGMRRVAEAASQAGQAVSQVGAGAAASARNVEASQRNIIAAIQRTTIAMEAGGKSTAAYYELLANQRGVNSAALAPYIAQLRVVEEAQARAAQATTTAQQQATESARAQATAQRELAQAQAGRDSFLNGLREQIALFGKSTEEVQRYHAAQLGLGSAADPLIAQLHAQRTAQEQVAAAARVAEQAQRDAAQVQAGKDNFIAGLREQIALFGLATEEVQRYRAAELGVAAAADPLIAQLHAMRTAQEQVTAAAKATAQAQRDAQQAQAGRDSFVQSLQDQVAAIGKTRIELLELKAAQMGVMNQAAPFIAQLRASEQGLHHGEMSAAAMSAALRQVPAQMTDIVVSLQGGQAPLTVLLQQGGQLRDMFGSVGGAAKALGGAVLNLVNPYTVTAAAVAALVIAYEKGHDEAIAFGRAIALSGNAAGTSVNQMADAARVISETSLGTKAAAAEVLVALVDANAVSSRSLQRAAEVALQMERVLGKAATDTAGEFAALRQAPLEGLQKLGEKYHFVTASTYAQVKALQDEGRQEQAAALAQNTYADEMEKRTKKVLENMGALQRGWMNVASLAKKGWDAILDIGRKETPQEEVGRINNVLSIKEAGLTSRTDNGEGNSTIVAGLKAEIVQLKARRAELQAGMEQERQGSEAAERSVKVEELRKSWLGESDILLTRQQLLKRDLNKEAEKGRELGLGEAEIQDRLTVVRRKYNDVYVQGIDTSITALRRRAEVESEVDKRELAQIASQSTMGGISESDAITQTAKIELAALDRQKKLLQDQLGMVRSKINSQREQADLEGQIAAAGEQRRTREKQQENDLAILRQKRLQESDELYAKGILGATAERDSLNAQLEAQFQSNQEIGLTTKQVAELRAARMDSAASLKDQSAAELEAIEPGSKLAALYREQAQALRDLGEAGVRGATKQELYEKNLDQLNAMVDVMSALDEATQSAAQGMADSFGRVGSAIGGLTTALSGYGRTQAAIAAQLASTIQDAHGDPTKIARANAAAAQASAQAQVKSYGDMANAAKDFFSENSAGYKVMGGIEKAYRATEMAMALESMAQKIFFKETEVAANTALNATKLTGEAATTAASTGLAATEASAWGITAVVKAIASMPFPLNLAAGAATLAAVVGLGVKLVGGLGGGSVSLSEQRQAAQGAGSVLGDKDAKSESISKALDLIEKNTYQGLAISGSMLASLRNIETSVASFASQLVSSTDITSPTIGLNANNGLAATVASAGLTAGGAAVGGMAGAGLSAFTAAGAVGGPIGMVAGAVLGYLASKSNFVGKIATSIFGGKQSVQDSGFTMDAASLATILSGGAKASQYADIMTSGGWFGRDKTSTRDTPLGDDANRQFTTIITSMADSIKAAGNVLGLSGDGFANTLNSFVVDIGKVSLKDLKGDELQKAIESVFSKLGDDMAQFAVAGLDQFQQIGEGYLETLARVATDYQTIDVVFQSLGKTFDLVGLSSVAARERLVDLAGGLDKFTSQGEYFLSNFFSEQEQAAALKKRITPTLAQYGLSTEGPNASKMFKDFVVGLDATTESGARAYSTLMAIAPAFKTVTDAWASEAGDLLDLQAQIFEALGDKAGAAAVLDKQHVLALQGLTPAMAAATKELWAAQAAAEAISKAQSKASGLMNSLDTAFSSLQSVVTREKTAIQTSIDVHTASVTKLQSLSQSLHSTLDSLKSPDQKLADRALGQAQIRTALAIAKAGGPLPAADSLKDALSAVTQDATSQFSSYTDYLRDLYQTQNDVANLAGITDDSLSVEEKSLDALNAQVKQLDLMVSSAQAQVDILKGSSTTLLSISQALSGFQLALVGAQKDPINAATAGITNAYQTALGRTPDAAGMEYWTNQATAGQSLSSIVQSISGSMEAQIGSLYKELFNGRAADAAGLNYWVGTGSSIDTIRAQMMQSDEYKKLHGIPGFATGGMFGGGLRIVGENGPELEATGPARIWSSNQTAALLARAGGSGGGDSSALAAEIKLLRETVANQQEALDKIAKSTGRHAEMYDNQTAGGRKPMPVEVKN